MDFTNLLKKYNLEYDIVYNFKFITELNFLYFPYLL